MLRVRWCVTIASLFTATLALGACDSPAAPPVPAAINVTAGNGLSAPAGTLLPATPTVSVADAAGHPISGVAVSVVVSGGGGSLVGAPTASSNVPVSIGNWTLGKTAGPNTLTVTVGTLPPQLITATGVPGAPTLLGVVSGNNQLLPAGTVVQPITVQIADQFGNGVPNISVKIAVVAGGGTLTGDSTITTNSTGSAVVPTWQLGTSATAQTLSANMVSGSLTTAINATVATNFHPEIRFFGPAVDPRIQQAFVSALQRVQGLVTGSLVPIPFNNIDVGAICGLTGVTPLNEVVPDMVIYATIRNIDGPGNIVGSSGPCLVRTAGRLTIIGVINFDVADIQEIVADGRVDRSVLHEMMHALGFGAGIWNNLGLITGAGTANSAFVGAEAIRSCQTTGGGIGICTPSIPLETHDGPGTADSHWRETVFTNELMTGYLRSVGVPRPLSVMTAASLKDLGYVVNLSSIDPYRPASLSSLQQLLAGTVRTPFGETIMTPRFEVTASGHVMPITKR